MKIGITGASGFIGSNLARYLHKKGHNVLALAPTSGKIEALEAAGISITLADVTDRASLDKAFRGMEVVVHLAALFNRPEASWEDYRWVNVQGTKNVLDAAKYRGVNRVVHCSTVGVATGRGAPPYSVETPYSAANDKYESTKCEGEKLALAFYREQDYPIVVIRPAQVYGPGDRSKAKFYRMIKKSIIVNPNGTLKHLVYIDDLCRAFELAIVSDSAVGRVFIIAGKEPTPLNELITIAARELDVPLPKFVIPARPVTWLCSIAEAVCNLARVKPVLFRRSMDFFIKSVEFDTRTTQEQLGFECQVDVRKGVHTTVAWYEAQHLI